MKIDAAKTRELEHGINYQEHMEPPPLAPENRPYRNKHASSASSKSRSLLSGGETDPRGTPRIGIG